MLPSATQWRRQGWTLHRGVTHHCRKGNCGLSVRGNKKSPVRALGLVCPGTQQSIQPWNYPKMSWTKPRTTQSTPDISPALSKKQNLRTFWDHFHCVSWTGCVTPLLKGWPQGLLRVMQAAFQGTKSCLHNKLTSPSWISMRLIHLLFLPFPPQLSCLLPLSCPQQGYEFASQHQDVFSVLAGNIIPMDYSNSLSP